MKIKSIGFSAPSIRLDNEDLLNLLKEKTTFLKPSDSNKYFIAISKLLDQAGARHRHCRDIKSGETAYDHIMGAARSAIMDAKVEPSDINLVIYCGVGKGVIEPSNAYYYASELGMHTAQCFDIADACMSWIRSLEVAKLYLDSGKASNVLVLTGEFHLDIRSPDVIKDFGSLRHTFPTYTIGEAATATILGKSANHWDFQYISRPEHFDLCTIPLNGYETYIRPNEKIGINGIGKFTSFGKELFGYAVPLLREVIKKGPNVKDVDMYFPHAASKTAYADLTAGLGIPKSKVFLKTFEDFGNIVSSSIPAGIHDAKKEGLISDDSKLCLIPASAGISCACVSFSI
jgi:3-oxoacyl-[acyl-carrier-protein] synthase III